MSKQKQAENSNSENTNLDTIKNNFASFSVVEEIIESTILQKAAQHLYEKYLRPKVRPFTVHDTMMLARQQIAVSADSETSQSLRTSEGALQLL